jgi:peptidyl-prolyl cis-trans isomerase A (cyclophilin A)
MLVSALALTLAQAAAPAAPAATPAATAVAASPVVALEILQGGTALGTITIVLDKEKAPITVANFLKYVRSGHFDGTIFHRVIPGFMIQGGGFTPQMVEKPTRAAIVNEAKNGLSNARGTVAMARLPEPNTATAQFFINLRDNHGLDYGVDGAGYAVFGRVTEGMDIVDKIAAVATTTRQPHENVPRVPIVIKRAREIKEPTTVTAKPAAAAPAKPPAASSPKP